MLHKGRYQSRKNKKHKKISKTVVLKTAISYTLVIFQQNTLISYIMRFFKINY